MNEPDLTEAERQALREALGEVPPTFENTALRNEISADFAAIRSVLKPSAVDATVDESPSEIPPAILAKLQDFQNATWEQLHRRAPIPIDVGRKIPQPVVTRWSKPAFIAVGIAALLAVLGVATKLVLPSGGTFQPTFAWENSVDSSQKYDVWVLPAEGDPETAAPLFKVFNKRSPVKLSEMQAADGKSTSLKKDEPHRLLVCLATVGKFGGNAVPLPAQNEIKVEPPTAPAVLKRLINAKRLTDAQKVLAALPASVRDEPEVLELAKQIPPQ